MGQGDGAEEAFLDALKQDPDDDARVVYTDWLEERADPRAEYLRLEAEFHELVLGAKRQVIAQYGDDSDEITSLGMKKKSERRYGRPRKAGADD